MKLTMMMTTMMTVKTRERGLDRERRLEIQSLKTL